VTNAEGNFLQVTPEAISFNGLASNALTISDGGGFEIGATVEVLPGVLAVYNGTSNTETNLTPTSLTIGTYANTTTNLLQDFSGYALFGPGYNAQRPVYGGITWTTSGGGLPDAGITKVNPALSSKAVTAAGLFPGANAQAAYLGNYLTSAPQPIGTYNGLILPTLTAQPGELVTLSYSYAGGQKGAVIVNGVQIQVINPSSVWVNASTSFYATGNDEVEFQTQVVPYTGNASQFNITNINFNFTVASTSTPQVSLVSPSRNSANYGVMNLSSLYTDGTTLGSYAQIGDAYNGITLQAAASGSSMLLGSNIGLNSTTNISLNSGTTNVGGTLAMGGNIAMGGNDITAGGTITASNLVGSTKVSTPVLDNPTAVLTIGTGSSSVVLNRASNIYTVNLDGAFSGNLAIGSNTATVVNMSNVSLITGKTQTYGLTISNCGILNYAPACGPALLSYLGNFSGPKGQSMTILPKITFTNTNYYVFGPAFGYGTDSYISNQGFTLPTYSVLSYSNLGSGTTQTYSNVNGYPLFVSDGGFKPSDTNQTYTLVPILSVPPPP
jgi:hypothetical protein